MTGTGLFTQVILIIFAVAIGITYVQPMFREIGTVQDNIELYQKEMNKVMVVEDLLESKVAIKNQVSVDDNRRLLTYLPDKIDEVMVGRDLLSIVEEAGLIASTIDLPVGSDNSSDSSAQSDGENVLIPHDFSLSILGTYVQLKHLIDLLARNDYPLELHEINIVGESGDLLSADLRIVTYSYQPGNVTEEAI